MPMTVGVSLMTKRQEGPNNLRQNFPSSRAAGDSAGSQVEETPPSPTYPVTHATLVAIRT